LKQAQVSEYHLASIDVQNALRRRNEFEVDQVRNRPHSVIGQQHWDDFFLYAVYGVLGAALQKMASFRPAKFTGRLLKTTSSLVNIYRCGF